MSEKLGDDATLHEVLSLLAFVSSVRLEHQKANDLFKKSLWRSQLSDVILKWSGTFALGGDTLICMREISWRRSVSWKKPINCRQLHRSKGSGYMIGEFKAGHLRLIPTWL